MMVKRANDGLLQANDGKMLVNDDEMVEHTLISPSLTSISPSLTSISPPFSHLTIIEKLHRLYSYSKYSYICCIVIYINMREGKQEEKKTRKWGNQRLNVYFATFVNLAPQDNQIM